MFYSHQLLARKAPLGQIWMAATLHAKINRKKLNKLDLVQICEEILNPAVPMALRLSAILMGGVVIVYERKVKILYDDVQRLLVEINEAWKVKSITDRNCLPRGKFQAKYEAVTLPDHVDEMEIGVGDGSDYRYFSMRLDQVEVPVNNGGDGDDPSIHHHQAEAVNITLFDPFDSYQMGANIYNRFQRFDIEEDEDTELISSTIREKSPVPVTLVASPPHQENSPVPVTLVSSTPLQKEPQPANDIQEQHPEPQVTEDALQPQQNEHERGPRKQRKRKEAKCFFMDYEQTIIPGHTYQSWLENPSDITLTKGKRKKVDLNGTMKTTHLMELPPVALCGLLEHGNKEVHYPAPLMELWQTCNHLPTTNASISGRTSTTLLPEQVLPPSTTHDQNPMEFPLEENPSSQEGVEPFEVPMENPGGNVNDMPRDVSTEKLSSNHINNGFPWKVSIGTPAINLVNFEMPINEANLFATPGNSGDHTGTIPSSGSGHDFQINNEEFQLRRSSRKRPYSSSHGRSNLESVAEEPSAPFEQGFKLPGVYEYSSTLDHEVLIETGPTPSQYPIVNPPVDKTTDFMRKHLKRHFDTPGVPQVESLNHLAFGMERHRAAQLFYQTCVLATHDFLRVEQTTPYGDIKISKGPKM